MLLVGWKNIIRVVAAKSICIGCVLRNPPINPLGSNARVGLPTAGRFKSHSRYKGGRKLLSFFLKNVLCLCHIKFVSQLYLRWLDGFHCSSGGTFRAAHMLVGRYVLCRSVYRSTRSLRTVVCRCQNDYHVVVERFGQCNTGDDVQILHLLVVGHDQKSRFRSSP